MTDGVTERLAVVRGRLSSLSGLSSADYDRLRRRQDELLKIDKMVKGIAWSARLSPSWVLALDELRTEKKDV